MRRMVSVICAEKTRIKDVIRKIEATDVEGYHIDCIDLDVDSNGNILNEIYKGICFSGKKMKEMHLMVANPEKCISSICKLAPDIVYVQHKVENLDEIMKQLNNHGIEMGVFVESDQMIDLVQMEKLIKHIRKIQILTVQKKKIGGVWLEYAKSNIQQLLELKKRLNAQVEIEIDGACSTEIIKEYSLKGIDAFVLGTKSGFFDEFYE